MTITLIIDTSFETCQVALYRDDVCIDSKREVAGGGHDRVLAGMVEKIFTAHNITPRDISKIFVTTGPGRFTGLRVGIAFARGFVLVHQTPLIPVPCNDAIAYDLLKKHADAKNMAVLIAVKRGQCFVQFIKPEKSNILVIEDDAMIEALQKHGPIVVGGVLSPVVAGFMPLPGVTVDGNVAEPSLEAIFAIGNGVAATHSGQNPVVRPYYAA